MENHILDESTRAKLVGLLPVADGASIQFTPSCFDGLPENIKPILTQRGLTKEERIEIEEFENSNLTKQMQFMETVDGVSRVSDDKVLYAGFIDFTNNKKRETFEKARRSIIGWKNVYCPLTGKALPFKADSSGAIAEDLYSGFNEATKIEIYENMKRISSLLPQEKLGLK